MKEGKDGVMLQKCKRTCIYPIFFVTLQRNWCGMFHLIKMWNVPIGKKSLNSKKSNSKSTWD